MCSCNHLDKAELDEQNAIKFEFQSMWGSPMKIGGLSKRAADMWIQENKEDNNKWVYGHIGSRLDSYEDPFSFLRKVAADVTHMDDDTRDIRRYGIGDVLEYLGYDTADGFLGWHNQDGPMNEIVVRDVDKIFDIQISDISQ